MIGCENSQNISEYKNKKILAVSRSRIDPNKGTFDWDRSAVGIRNRLVAASQFECSRGSFKPPSKHNTITLLKS